MICKLKKQHWVSSTGFEEEAVERVEQINYLWVILDYKYLEDAYREEIF